MSILGAILLVIIRFYTLLVIARIITEMIGSFSRSFSPPRWFATLMEPTFMLTDPPVKLLRRAIPPLRTGGVALDLSVIVLLFILYFVQILVIAIF